jgi:hypothetical protein
MEAAGSQQVGLRAIENPYISSFVSEYRRHILGLTEQNTTTGISCFELASLCKATNCQVQLSLLPEASISAYNAVMTSTDRPELFDVFQAEGSSDERRFSNDPLSTQKNASFVGAIRAYVDTQLPGLAPRNVFRLAAIPKAPDGTIDRAAMHNFLHAPDGRWRQR